MNGDADPSGRRRRRDAAPTNDPAAFAAHTSTRSSRSSAAASHHHLDGDLTAPPPRSRPTRASRSAAAPRSSRRVSSSPAGQSGIEQDDGEQDDAHDGDQPDAYDQAEDDNNDGGDDDDDEFSAGVPSGRGQRSLRIRIASARQDEEAPSQPSGRPSRQRSTANLRNAATPPPVGRSRRSESRPVKAEDATQQPLSASDSAIESGSDDEGQSPRSRGKRSVRAKSQSSPLKMALNNRAYGAAAARPSGGRKAQVSDESEGGWLEEIEMANEAQDVYFTIIATIRKWLRQKHVPKLSGFLENSTSIKDDRTVGKVESSVTLKSIEQHVQSLDYNSSIDFEKDMMQLFRNARRHFEIGSETYGHVVVLQRMYQHLTQSVDAAREPIDEDTVSRNYASVRYGPCQEVEGEGCGEMPSTGDKSVVPRLYYKGNVITVGNWVHISNPTDPARPIVAQIFKTRTEDLGDHHQDWVTACWFLRPEQSRHPRSMMFWENEVIKTSQLVEHHVEDILEMICVMFYTKASRGRPIDGEGGWHTDDPLYICENRYQVDKDAFFKIKNWASCLPEEVKNKRFDMIEYDQPITLPEKLNSPFLRGVEGPGEIVKEVRPSISIVSTARKTARISNAAESEAVGKPGQDYEIPQLFKQWRNEVQAQRRAFLNARAEQRLTNERGSAPIPVNGMQLSGISPQPQQSPSSLAAPGSVPPNFTPSPHGAMQPLPGTPAGSAAPRMPLIAEAIDRSLNNALSQTDVSAYFKTLPDATRQLFHQDPETGTVVWYPAPPIVGPSNADLQRKWNDGERFQAHSLDYLYHMATGKASEKRKRPSASVQSSSPATKQARGREEDHVSHGSRSRSTIATEHNRYIDLDLPAGSPIDINKGASNLTESLLELHTMLTLISLLSFLRRHATRWTEALAPCNNTRTVGLMVRCSLYLDPIDSMHVMCSIYSTMFDVRFTMQS